MPMTGKMEHLEKTLRFRDISADVPPSNKERIITYAVIVCHNYYLIYMNRQIPAMTIQMV